MNSPQNLQNSFQKFQIEQKFEEDSFILTPKAPNLRPCDSPNIEFEDFLLPEPLLGEEAFQEEDELCDEELEDFFLDEAPSQQTIGGCQPGVPEKPAEKTASVHVQKRGKVERYLNFSKKKL